MFSMNTIQHCRTVSWCSPWIQFSIAGLFRDGLREYNSTLHDSFVMVSMNTIQHYMTLSWCQFSITWLFRAANSALHDSFVVNSTLHDSSVMVPLERFTWEYVLHLLTSYRQWSHVEGIHVWQQRRADRRHAQRRADRRHASWFGYWQFVWLRLLLRNFVDAADDAAVGSREAIGRRDFGVGYLHADGRPNIRPGLGKHVCLCNDVTEVICEASKNTWKGGSGSIIYWKVDCETII